jgi:hypothetical protein
MDPWVKVVNLGGEVCEVELTSVEIQSNEPERPGEAGLVLFLVDRVSTLSGLVEFGIQFAPGGDRIVGESLERLGSQEYLAKRGRGGCEHGLAQGAAVCGYGHAGGGQAPQ